MGNSANILRSIVLSSAIMLGGSSCSIVKTTQKDLSKNLNDRWQYNDSKEKTKEHQNKAYRKLVRKLAKEYSKSEDGGIYHGNKEVSRGQVYTHDQSGERIQVCGKMKDFYSEKYHSVGEKGDSLINHTQCEGAFFSKRELFYQQLLEGTGEGEYGIIIKNVRETSEKAYKIYDTIDIKDFDEIIKKMEKSPLVGSKYEDSSRFDASDRRIDFKTHLSMFCSKEEKMLWLLPEIYYDQIKGHAYETYGTLVDKPSDKMLRFAEKHGFTLKPKLLVLKNIDSYDTKYQKADKIELQGIYIRLPEKKSDTIGLQDTISQITTAQIQETEKQMNEIFEYGQKSIFKSNSKEFSNETVEEGLDKLYDMLKKNPSLNIKVTGYYGGKSSTLPLERAEKVKKYLVKKGIAAERITAKGAFDQIARSIKIEIIQEKKIDNSTIQQQENKKIDFISPRLEILKSEYTETETLLDSIENKAEQKVIKFPDHAIRVLLKKDGYFDQTKTELKAIYEYIQDTPNHDIDIIEKNIDNLQKIQKELLDIEKEMNDPENNPKSFQY